jgi:hypothetical protein
MLGGSNYGLAGVLAANMGADMVLVQPSMLMLGLGTGPLHDAQAVGLASGFFPCTVVAFFELQRESYRLASRATWRSIVACVTSR